MITLATVTGRRASETAALPLIRPPRPIEQHSVTNMLPCAGAE